MLTTSTGSPILYHPGRQMVRMSDGEESPGSDSDAAMRKVKSAPRLQRGVLRLWGPRTEGHMHKKEISFRIYLIKEIIYYLKM
jgi:hypothetical protein